MALLQTASQLNVPIATPGTIGVANRSSINLVVDTDVAGSGTLEIFAKIGSSSWIDTTQSIDLAAATGTIVSVTGGPYSTLKLEPTPVAGKIETQTDFVFDAAGKTITTVAGTFTGFADGDVITVSGTTLNDGVYTIVGAPTLTVITVVEVLADETPAVTMTIKSFGASTNYNIHTSIS